VAKPGIFLLLFVTFAVASPCHDPRLRSAAVVGDAIRGAVSMNRKPVRLAQVHLYSAGRLVSTGTTDKDGRLTIDHLSPDKYQLSIAGWGSVPVEVVPQPKGYHFMIL
jgi:Prealbumin-like fold domain